jgi:hypothetical protein
MHSYSNKDDGKAAHKRLPIGHKKEHVPPAGEHNSYEKVREKIDAHDNKSLAHRPYTREKMMNK